MLLSLFSFLFRFVFLFHLQVVILFRVHLLSFQRVLDMWFLSVITEKIHRWLLSCFGPSSWICFGVRLFSFRFVIQLLLSNCDWILLFVEFVVLATLLEHWCWLMIFQLLCFWRRMDGFSWWCWGSLRGLPWFEYLACFLALRLS